MNEPLISIVMSVYNSEEYLDEAINSILNQTYTKFEFIIINDGSRDGSLDIIKKYLKRDKRIILVDNKINKGLVYSLNKGLDISKGKYIVRMDADDISLRERLEKQVNFMEQNSEITMSGTAAFVFKGNNRKVNKKLSVPTEVSKVKSKLFFENCFIHPTVIMRRDHICKYKLKYDDVKGAEDIALWIKMSKLNLKLDNINIPLLYYRLSKNSITSNENKNIENRYNVFKKYRSIQFEILGIEKIEKNLRILFEIALDSYIKNIKFTLENKRDFLWEIVEKNKKIKYFEELCAKKYCLLCMRELNYDIYIKSQFFKIFKVNKSYFYKEALKYITKNTIKKIARRA